jgi:hypothetical protein
MLFGFLFKSVFLKEIHYCFFKHILNKFCAVKTHIFHHFLGESANIPYWISDTIIPVLSFLISRRVDHYVGMNHFSLTLTATVQLSVCLLHAQ